VYLYIKKHLQSMHFRSFTHCYRAQPLERAKRCDWDTLF
jgi:hypothetical protein